MPDLTIPKGVRTLMRSSLSLDDWNANCTAVRDANVTSTVERRLAIEELMISGLYEEVSQNWTNRES